jgi:Glycosyl hydrolase family 76
MSRPLLIFSALALISSRFLAGASPLSAVAQRPIGVAQVSVLRRRPPTMNPHRAAAAPRRATAAQQPLSIAQQHYLLLARSAVAQSERWRDPGKGWYYARLDDHDRYPLARIWDIVPLFEALDAIAIAAPTRADLVALTRFAAGAERYLNRGLRPLPGYSPYPGDRTASTETWFDDNGWWGLAFLNAYRATGRRRYLNDAQRALDYIAAAGWDPEGGGIWWNTSHPFKAGAALASGTLLATLLYQQTHSAFDLGQALGFLNWANTSGFVPAQGLYADTSLEPTPVDYIEAPLIYAQALLCQLTATPADCERAEELKATALKRFGFMLDFAPQYDAIYLQWMLALYSLDHDPGLYTLAAHNATDAQIRALNSEGLYLLSWGGETLPPEDAQPGMLQTQAATASLFAWLAVYLPPS